MNECRSEAAESTGPSTSREGERKALRTGRGVPGSRGAARNWGEMEFLLLLLFKGGERLEEKGTQRRDLRNVCWVPLSPLLPFRERAPQRSYTRVFGFCEQESPDLLGLQLQEQLSTPCAPATMLRPRAAPSTSRQHCRAGRVSPFCWNSKFSSLHWTEQLRKTELGLEPCLSDPSACSLSLHGSAHEPYGGCGKAPAMFSSLLCYMPAACLLRHQEHASPMCCLGLL